MKISEIHMYWKKRKNDEENEIMDLENEFEYLSGQISKDQYELYLSYADLKKIYTKKNKNSLQMSLKFFL